MLSWTATRAKTSSSPGRECSRSRETTTSSCTKVLNWVGWKEKVYPVHYHQDRNWNEATAQKAALQFWERAKQCGASTSSKIHAAWKELTNWVTPLLFTSQSSFAFSPLTPLQRYNKFRKWQTTARREPAEQRWSPGAQKWRDTKSHR